MTSEMRADTRIPTPQPRIGRRPAVSALLLGAVVCFHTTGALAQQPEPDSSAGGPPPSSIPGTASPIPDGPAEAAPEPPSASSAQYAPAPPAPAPAPGQSYGYPPNYAPPSGYGQAPGQYPPPPPPPGGSGGYGPPSGYRPAPRYGYPPPPPSFYPPPPPTASRLGPGSDRPFMIGGSLGFAGLRFRDGDNQPTSDAAIGYSARLGFGVAPNLLFLLAVDGATTGDGNFVYDQTLFTAGVQAFLGRQLFLRAGAGIGNITQKESQGNFLVFGKSGLGLTGTAGVELIQGYNWSLELAAQVTAGFYSDNEQWTSGAVNIGFNFF